MAYPRTPGGLFPLTTTPTGNNAGGQYPTTDRLVAGIRGLAPTAYWRLGDAAGPLLDTAQPTSTTITLATSADADDIVDTVENHGFVTGDTFTFATLTGGSNVTAGTTYYVIATSLAAKTFKFSATAGGAAVDFGSDITAGTIVRAAPSFWNAAVTGSPTYGVAASSPIGRGVTWSGSGQYATTTLGSFPTPTASMSAFAFIRTSTSTAASHSILARNITAGSQSSWDLRLNSSHFPLLVAMQSAGATHAVATVASACNDGQWHLIAGTFDGTTIWCHRITQAGALTSASSTSLTGSWKKDTTSGMQIAHANGAQPFEGTEAHAAYFNDRVLSTSELRYLASIAFGG